MTDRHQAVVVGAEDDILIDTYGAVGNSRPGWFFHSRLASYRYRPCLVMGLPAVLGGHPPAAIASRGIPVEPTHVIDLGILLPGSILAGILLLRAIPGATS